MLRARLGHAAPSLLLSARIPSCTCSLAQIASSYPSAQRANGRRAASTSSSSTPRDSSTAPRGERKKKTKERDPAVAKWSSSILLPKTAFPLRADAATRDKIFARRTTTALYERQAAEEGRPLWVLHDGPPYANGNLHIGHALNKILKDIINRYKLLRGYRVHYVPGWDTHGLPLELKALSNFKAPARSLSPLTVRAAARLEALDGIDTQRSEFTQFALLGQWGDELGYKTLEWSYERKQLELFRDMVTRGVISTHYRPTLYSPSSRTALAEAEIEYNDLHVSRSVYVALDVAEQGQLSEVTRRLGLESERVQLAVWTTTPWTLPGNAAVAVSPTMAYALVKVGDGRLLVVLEERLEAMRELLQAPLETLATLPGSQLLSTTYHTLFTNEKGSTTRPVIAASHVTEGSGTGLVHTAPAHGVEDWDAWRAYLSTSEGRDDDALSAVDADGNFSREALDGAKLERQVTDRLAGLSVLKEGSAEVIAILRERGETTLMKEVEMTHRYPYDWRTKKPVIYRATSQWFANLERLKDSAQRALDDVRFLPPSGEQRLRAFLGGRSEWCISRQRAWGVPIPVVYSYDPSASSGSDSATTPLLTPSNVEHIVGVLDAHPTKSDYWWTGEAAEFVEPAERARAEEQGLKWRKGTDTMDVWFDSGSSWMLLRDEWRVRAQAPYADLYLEGTDQHRGWFQSSLLTSVAASSASSDAAVAPYKMVMTHGMVLDERGRKMSKSLGNVISPLGVIHGGKNKQREPAYGADCLRLWCASVDATRDVPIGPAILQQTADALRKIRNTAKFLIGNLHAGHVPEHLNVEELGLVERYVLNELHEFTEAVTRHYDTFAFNRVYQLVVAFTNTMLSAFYFNIVKDTLYTERSDSVARQRVAYVLKQILDVYNAVLAPITPHLAEEIAHFAASSEARDPPPSLVTCLNCGADVDEHHSREVSFFERRPIKSAGENTSDDDYNEGEGEGAWRVADPSWRDKDAAQVMRTHLLPLRERVLALLEQARQERKIGSSNEADVELHLLHSGGGGGGEQGAAGIGAIVEAHKDILASLFIVSEVRLVTTSSSTADVGGLSHAEEQQQQHEHEWSLTDLDIKTDASTQDEQAHMQAIGIKVVNARREKCPRCWVHRREERDELCARCARAVSPL